MKVGRFYDKLLEGLVKNPLADRAPGTPEETLESAGCTGGCPTYPGAPKTVLLIVQNVRRESNVLLTKAFTMRKAGNENTYNRYVV